MHAEQNPVEHASADTTSASTRRLVTFFDVREAPPSSTTSPVPWLSKCNSRVVK